MTVQMYNFSKKLNSTAKPSGTGTQHDCKLKAGCSEHDPVLLLQSTSLYDYAYISAWGKYYFVHDIVFQNNNISEYHLTEDVLATYKTPIGSTIARIIYSASATRNPDIIDSRIQIKATKTIVSDAGSKVFSGDLGYILTVFNTDYGVESSGFSVSYLLNEDAMKRLRYWFSTSTIAADMRQFFNGSPLSGVFSCKLVPYFTELAASNQAVSTQSIMIGASNTGNIFTTGDVYVLNARPQLSDTQFFSIGNRYGDFRDYEPYTKSYIFLPGIGSVGLSRNDFTGTKIQVKTYIEAITGDIKYTIFDDDSNANIAEFNGNISSDCAMGQMVQNTQGVMTGIGQTAGAVVSLGGAIAVTAASNGVTAPMVAGIVSSAASVIAGVANTVLAANQHTASIAGSNSNTLSLHFPYIDYYELSVDTEDPANSNYKAVKGVPYIGTTTISSFSGFLQCEGASVSCSGTDTEKAEINAYLNNGFFYE